MERTGTPTRPGSVLILRNSVTAESPADARDILDQSHSVETALRTLGYDVSTLAVTLALDQAMAELRVRHPDVIFNLVEAIEDSGQLVFLATGLLDYLGIPYTGGDSDALVLTSNKILTKRWLAANGLPTTEWWDPTEPAPMNAAPGPWIVKPLWEDASIGMDDDSVVTSFREVAARIAAKRRVRPCRWFAERFVDGREINVAILAGENGPEILPIAEIEFVGFPSGKPRIVGYAAKWFEDSFECRNTPRRFLEPGRDSPLYAELTRLAVECWRIFGLGGYARVDFRVDEAGRPWILEINVNPCIAPDAGFAAALRQAGLSYADGIGRIIADALRRAALQ